MSERQPRESLDATRWWRSRWTSRLALGAAVVVAFGAGLCVGDAPNPSAGRAAVGDGHEHAEEEWTCPMHPQIRSPEPGNCPICGMTLVPVRAEAEGGDDPRRITISERAKVLARVRTERARPMPAAQREGRLLGRLDYDETRVKTVTAWTDGRIDRLRVAATGARIRRGQVIATLYSPEIYAAQSDLILAAGQLERLDRGDDLSKRAAEAALEAARQRLRLLGVTSTQLADMESADRPERHVGIRSQFAGTVIERLVDEGSYVSAGSGLYRVADLSQLWVQLDAYESDLPFLEVGQSVTLEVTAIPGRAFTGKVTFIDPVISPRKRTARVRVEVANPDGALKPGMFAEAVVRGKPRGEAADGLLIPESAPLFTGRRSIVYVEVPNSDRPTYEAREVELGPKVGRHYPVLSGLENDERVVVRGAFALDADLQIRGGDSMMSRPDDATRRKRAPITDIPPAMETGLASVVNAYLTVQQGLADDDLAAAQSGAEALLDAVAEVQVQVPDRLRRDWQPIESELEDHARHITGSRTDAHARMGFDGLSVQLLEMLRRFGNPTQTPLRRAYCPMAFENRGAEWVQRGDEIRNPYFGAEMLTCGEIRATVAPGDHLARTTGAPSHGAPAGGHRH